MERKQAFEATNYSHLQDQNEIRKYIVCSLKCIVICLIILVLSIIIGIKLYFSLINPPMYSVGYSEFSCPSQNISCQSLLCPEGMAWTDDICSSNSPSDIRCCMSSSTSILSCSRKNCSSSLVSASVVPSGQQVFCRTGYLWVPWRRKCFRSD